MFLNSTVFGIIFIKVCEFLSIFDIKRKKFEDIKTEGHFEMN